MPHQLLHHLELDSEAPEQSAVGVAERVPPDALLNTQLFGGRLDVVTHDRPLPSTAFAHRAGGSRIPSRHRI